MLYLKQTMFPGFIFAAILCLQFKLHAMLNTLSIYITTCRNICTMLNMAIFCSTSMSFFLFILQIYFLSGFDMVPVAPIINGINFVFVFLLRCIVIVMSFYFKIFLGFFLDHISVS